MIQTEKIGHQDRAQLVGDKDYFEKLARALKYWKATRTFAPIVVVLGLSALILAGIIALFTNFLLLLIVPIVLLGVAMYLHGTRQGLSDDVVWSVMRAHYQQYGFTIDCAPIDNYNQLSLQELGDLINKSLDRHALRDEGIRFETENVGGHIYQYVAEIRKVDSKGSSYYANVFKGIVISLDESNLSIDVDIQIAPISTVGRLFQDTLSTLSGTFSDVRFSNETLNDRLVLRTEGLMNRFEHNEWLGQRFSSNVEEVLYQLYVHYGVFWLRMYRGKIWLAFPENSALVFSGEGRLNRYMLPDSELSTETFEPRKWAELLYVIGAMESLVFHVREMVAQGHSTELKLASDFDALIQNKVSLANQDYQTYHDFQQETRVSKILSDEYVTRYRKEYEEGE